MRILVTGAGGFLGHALIDNLHASGHHVRGLVTRPSPFLKNMCDVIVGDIRDLRSTKRAMTGSECVVHLAGKAHALDNHGIMEDDYRSVNVEGTRQLLKEAKAAGVQKFVFASSVKVFGETTNGCVDERAPAAPETPYARSKWSAEQLVRQYADSGGFRALSLRLPMVYGPTEKGNLFRMIRAIDHGRFPPLPPLKSVRSMLHVDTFTQAVLRVLKAETWLRPCYIVADPTAYSATTIYELLCTGLGKPVPTWRIPLPLLKAAGRTGDMIQILTGRRVLFTSDTLQKLIGSACYSAEALMRDMNYRPQLSFQQAVPELVAHYRASLV